MIHIKNNFNEEVLNYEGITIVDFWAPWCGPCKMFGPIFEKANNSKFKFCKFNIDEDEQDIRKNLGIMSIPTIIVFENGKEIKRHIGFMNENEFNKFLGDLDV